MNDDWRRNRRIVKHNSHLELYRFGDRKGGSETRDGREKRYISQFNVHSGGPSELGLLAGAHTLIPSHQANVTLILGCPTQRGFR